MPKISGAAAVADLDEDDDAERRGPMRATVHMARDAELRPEVISDPVPVNEEMAYVYERPNQLKAPPPRPGYVQRWVRMETRGVTDPTNNYHNKITEGFMPRPPETVGQDWRHLAGVHEGINAIRIGSLVLCEKPEFKSRAKRKFIRGEIDKQNTMITGGGPEHQRISQEGVQRGFVPLVHDEGEEVRYSRHARRPATMVS